MKLSTRGRYGIRVLLDLALHQGEGRVPLRDIARRQQISQQYLGHLVAPLVTGGVVLSSRGPGGGVSLARPGEQITLCEVFELLEGPISLVECINNPETCDRSGVCATQDVWGELKRAMDGVLESTTLQDLVRLQRSKEQPAEAMYYI